MLLIFIPGLRLLLPLIPIIHLQTCREGDGRPVEAVPERGVIPVLCRANSLGWSWRCRGEQDVDFQTLEEAQVLLSQGIPSIHQLGGQLD